MLLLIGFTLVLTLCIFCLLVYRWQNSDKAAVKHRIGHYLDQTATQEIKQSEPKGAGVRQLSGWRALVQLMLRAAVVGQIFGNTGYPKNCQY